MNIFVQHHATQRILTLEGDFTIYTAAESKVQLLEALADANDVEINLAQVSELDSAGAQLLMLIKREALQKKIQLRLSAHSTAVLDIFELYNLASFFGDPLLMPNDNSDVLSRSMT